MSVKSDEIEEERTRRRGSVTLTNDHGRSREPVRASAGQQEPDSAAGAKIRVPVTVREPSAVKSIADRESRADESDGRRHVAQTNVGVARALGEPEAVGAGGERSRSAGDRETRRRPEPDQAQGSGDPRRSESALRSSDPRHQTATPRRDERGRESGGEAAGLQSVEDHSTGRAVARPAPGLDVTDGAETASAAQSRSDSEAATAAAAATTYVVLDGREYRHAATIGTASQGYRDEHDRRETSAGEQFGFRCGSAA